MSLSRHSQLGESARYGGRSYRSRENATGSTDTSHSTSTANLRTYQDTTTGEVVVEMCGHQYRIDSTSSFDDDEPTGNIEISDFANNDRTNPEIPRKITDSVSATANDSSVPTRTQVLFENVHRSKAESTPTTTSVTGPESSPETENRVGALITNDAIYSANASFVPRCSICNSMSLTTRAESITLQHHGSSCNPPISLTLPMPLSPRPVTIPILESLCSQTSQTSMSLRDLDTPSTLLDDRTYSSRVCPEALLLPCSDLSTAPFLNRTSQMATQESCLNDVPLCSTTTLAESLVTQSGSSQPLQNVAPLCVSSENLNVVPVYAASSSNTSQATASWVIVQQPVKIEALQPALRVQIAPQRRSARKTCRLWEHIRNLLLDPTTNPSQICWEDKEKGMFKLVQPRLIAHMWGMKKGNPNMTYEKFSRAMRYYYRSRVLAPVPGKRHCYRFGPNAHGWM